jgi:tRNA threonylcarbamoyl adenosine modification protein YjeE
MTVKQPDAAPVVLPGVTEPQLERLGEDIAFAARPGDLITLSGALGAGKTTLARALIRALTGSEEEIPSPTFTLVQTYTGARMPVAHFDLYRLADASELGELGLDLALRQGLAIVEWPERAAGALPADRLEVSIEDEGPLSRKVTLTGRGDWDGRMPRLRAMRDFLAGPRAQREACALGYLQGDASVRRYARLSPRTPASTGTILMDWARQPDGPPIRNGMPYSRIAHLAEDVHPFVAIGTELGAHGFSVPEILAQDLSNGFLLIEDLGNRVFAEEVRNATADQAELWRAATDALVELQGLPPPDRLEAGGAIIPLARYDEGALGIEIELLIDWYWEHAHGTPPTADARWEFLSLWATPVAELAALPPGWVLRDYHSPNLLWLPERSGIRRVGIIDFQDAMRGAPAYDLVSLLQDARVDVPEELQDELFERYCRGVAARRPDFDRSAFAWSYAALGAQRNTKILGIFARLAKRDHKPQYLRHVPRLWRYLERNLEHPGLSRLKSWYDRHLPAEKRGSVRPAAAV